MRFRLAAMLVIAGLAGGCAERHVFEPTTSDSRLSRVDGVARAFALGMADQAVREAVRDAMRASPWTEHKLSLREFVTTSSGGLLVRSAAAAAGTQPEALEATIAALPELDFYVPARQQRLTWRGSSQYLIAVGLNGQAPIAAYNATGRTEPIDLSGSEAPAQVLFMLATPEIKTHRIHSQQNLSGSTIQDPDDGDLGGELVFSDANGELRTIELADLSPDIPLVQCYEDCSTGGGGGSAPPETFLTRIQTQGIVDNNNPLESNEFEFSVTAWDGSTGFLRITGVPSTTDQVRHDHLIYAVPLSETSGLTISVKETDGWPNPDDHFYFVPVGNTYCGPVHLGLNENGAGWALTEDSCSFNPKLGLYFGW